MSFTADLLLLICALVCCRAQSLVVSNFRRELTLYNSEIILGKHIVTKRGSIVYAACEQTSDYFFSKMECNVTIEAPVFAKSLSNHTCRVVLVGDNPQTDKLNGLKLDALNDHRVLLSWSVRKADHSWHTKIRILTMANCQYADVSLPFRNFAHMIIRKSGFDLLVNYQSFCGSLTYCKVSFDSSARKTSGPIRILYDSDVPVVIPSSQPFLEEGYLLAGANPRGYIVNVEPDGKLNPLMAIKIPHDQTLRASISSLYGYYSLCVLVNGTTVTCYVYEQRSGFRMNATLQLDKRESSDARWIAVRNLRGKSLLLATGKVSQGAKNAESFSVIKLRPDGRWGNKFHVGGINFKGVDEFHVRMSKNKLDELCFHFVGKQSKSYQAGTINRLKIAIKCVPKSYVTADNLLIVNK